MVLTLVVFARRDQFASLVAAHVRLNLDDLLAVLLETLEIADSLGQPRRLRLVMQLRILMSRLSLKITLM